jgi:type III secretion system HrpE/YscL family protein
MTMAILHRHGQEVLSLSGARVHKAAFEAITQADEVLRVAQEAARALREDTERVLSAQRAQAHAEGFQRGRAEGMVAVLGTLEVERRLRELLTTRIADVVEQCVRSMLGDIPPTEVFQRRVRQLIRQGGGSGAAKIHVYPAQAHLVHAVVAEQAQLAGGELQWLTVVSDDHCPRDFLVLETQVGFIDASMDLTLAGAKDIISRAVMRASTQFDV